MRFFIVDVFAEKKYQGNQLAVFIPQTKLSDSDMQLIAKEINFQKHHLFSKKKMIQAIMFESLHPM